MDQRRLLPQTRQSLVSDGSMSNRMKRGLAGVMALGTLLLSTAAMAAPQRCATLDQQEQFELSALKTELMVVAVTCQQSDNYNAFVQRYQATLSANDRAVIDHFSGRDKRAGQRANDTFITNLANSRTQEANRVGADFCARNARLFKEVMGLNNASELPAYAAAKDLIPVSMGACPLSATAVATAPAARGGKATARRAAR
jgi:hypothetical protein